jgi:iron complex outermembrane receptor protein
VEVGGGSYGSFHAEAATDVGTSGRLSVDASQNRYADDETSVDRVHGRYRLRLPHGIQVDADAVALNQDPASPSPRKGPTLDPAIPLDANHNPEDAKLDSRRYQISATQSTRVVNWTFAASRVNDDNIRGFLVEDARDSASTPNARGYVQERELTEFYGLAHHRFASSKRFGITVGGDVLFGKGTQESENFDYYAALDGSRKQASADGVPVEETEFEAERTFLGAFAEADWHPSSAWTVLLGVRFNDVEETREGETEVDSVETPATVKDSETRPGGAIGVTWQAWHSGLDDLVLYANARDTFKPAAIDFGPEAEVDPLEPETARSVEFGVRTALADSRLHLDASVFRMDFENLVVSTIVDGNPALANAGTERFDGVELDSEFRFNEQWRAMATYAWHEATFLDYEQDFGGVLTSLDGKFLELSPKHLASGGLAYTGPKFHGEVLTNYIGERFLNKRNTAKAEAYTTVDASVGARFSRLDLRLTGRNLTDRRDPVAESELGEAQYYRLPAASVELAATVGL